MAKASYYNQYPEGFLEPFTEPVTFKLVNIHPDPENKGAWLMPMFTNVPATSQVTDENGNVVNLALVRTVTADGEAVFDIESLILGQMTNGEIQLTPKKPGDVAKFNYINHCHWNRDSKYTYPGAEHIVYKFDIEALAKGASVERASKKDALVAAMGLSDDRVKAIFAKVGTGNPNSLRISQMRNTIEEMALENPEKILKAIGVSKRVEVVLDNSDDAEESSVEEIVNLAIKSGRLKKYNPALSWRSVSGVEVFKFARASEGKGTPEQQLIAAAENDAELFAIIAELVD